MTNILQNFTNSSVQLKQSSLWRAYGAFNTVIRCNIREDQKRQPIVKNTKRGYTNYKRRQLCVRAQDSYVETLADKRVQEINNLDGGVVIVGGGPAGLGAAMMLAKRGWDNITVLEKRSSASFYEPDRSYSYLISGRGQSLLQHLDFMDELEKAGVPQSTLVFKRVEPDAKVKELQFNLDDALPESYWLPRKKLLSIMYERIAQEYAEAVNVEFDSRLMEMNLSVETEQLSVEYVNKVGEVKKINPKLVIGCDGANSSVRQKLEQVCENGRFQIHQYLSPAVGLRYKVMTMPPNFTWNKYTGEKSTCTQPYAFESISRNDYKRLKIGCLPFKDPHSPRTGNFITIPDHYLWTIKTGEELLAYLEEEFPQLEISREISLEELDRLAKSEGGRFPAASYSDGVQLQFGQKGVVILGDALHFFPPDLGQGVNSAFEDVWVLEKALEEMNDDIQKALPLFEERRLEDSKALIKLVQTVAPYQYGQDKLGQSLWLLWTIISSIAHKLLPQVFGLSAFWRVNDANSPYSEILKSRQDNNSKLQFVIGALSGLAFISLLGDLH
eukprot:TRINITY_DN1075_c0_g1_i7.p1 TRINITY_DN1075_c0_g1~~TRINITY_DN1075_c0_g1_i7.p1  ORF type:complete len:556 (+),score=67.53 TRINITY_DN1075_c0_g1_i7:191-1858(+)